MSKKYTIEEVRSVFNQAGYELLSEIYNNSHDYLFYRCHSGHINKVKFYSFKNGGSRCPSCYGNQKLTFDYVRQEFDRSGIHLLDSEYVNSTTFMRFKCSCGRIWQLSWAEFQQGRRRCRACGFESYRGEKHPRWEPDRAKLALLRKVSDKAHSALKTTLYTLGKRKCGKTRNLLGYTNVELLEHIQNHPAWVQLKNCRWSLDHIFPIKAFINHGIEDVALINCLDNLQPMLLNDNCSKNDNYDQQAFEIWLAARRQK